MLTLLYFAKLKDDLNCGQETLEWQTQWQTVNDVLKHLKARDELWNNALSVHRSSTETNTTKNTLLCAVNQRISDFSGPIKDGNELAFFPPVTGG